MLDQAPFTAFDETGIVGFFTLRNPGESLDELRFGFVIVNPCKRGKGYGKNMLQSELKFAFEIYGAKKVSLGVFENNLPAYCCYKAVGFRDVVLDTPEKYSVMGEEWKCRELYVTAGVIYGRYSSIDKWSVKGKICQEGVICRD